MRTMWWRLQLIDMFPTTAVEDKFPTTDVSNSIATTHIECVVLLERNR